MSDAVMTKRNYQESESVCEPTTAVPSVRVPRAEDNDSWSDEEHTKPNVQNPNISQPDESWPDEDLLHCCQVSVEQGNEYEKEGIAFLRLSIRARWRGCRAASIFRQRHRGQRDWCAVQKKSKLPRTTLWEMAEVYDRATDNGHGEDELAAKYRTWTDLKTAYGVAKPKKSRKQDAGQPAHAELVSNRQGDTKHEDDDSVQDPVGNDPTQPETTQVTQRERAKPDADVEDVVHKPHPPASSRSLRRQKKSIEDQDLPITPCETEAAVSFVQSFGSWKRAFEAADVVTGFVNATKTWERAMRVLQYAKELEEGKRDQ